MITPIEPEVFQRLKDEVRLLQQNGIQDMTILRRLDRQGIPKDVRQKLIPMTKEAKALAEKPPVDLLELVDSTAHALDKALPILWKRVGPLEQETMTLLRIAHTRLMEALNESARANGQQAVYGTDGKSNFRLGVKTF